MIAWPDLGVVITPPSGLNPEAIGGRIPGKPGNFESLKPEAAAWGALPAFLQTECKPKMNRLAQKATLSIDVTFVGDSCDSCAWFKSSSSRTWYLLESLAHAPQGLEGQKAHHFSWKKTDPQFTLHQWPRAWGQSSQEDEEFRLTNGSQIRRLPAPRRWFIKACRWSRTMLKQTTWYQYEISFKTISNPFTHFDVASKLHSASKWQHVVRTKELSVWPSVQVPQLPPEHENSMSLRLSLPNLQGKKAMQIEKPIQLALQKAESTERFSTFSLHVKRCRKVRSCVLPVLLLQHKDMSCGANLYQLYHWGNPMCSEDAPSNLTWICSGKCLKCQNADDLDIFRHCRWKSSSHPSQLQTLLKTACVCTQGVWFKGIDDIHQHLVSLRKLQHIFPYIRSKV